MFAFPPKVIPFSSEGKLGMVVEVVAVPEIEVVGPVLVGPVPETGAEVVGPVPETGPEVVGPYPVVGLGFEGPAGVPVPEPWGSADVPFAFWLVPEPVVIDVIERATLESDILTLKTTSLLTNL